MNESTGIFEPPIRDPNELKSIPVLKDARVNESYRNKKSNAQKCVNGGSLNGVTGFLKPDDLNESKPMSFQKKVSVDMKVKVEGQKSTSSNKLSKVRDKNERVFRDVNRNNSKFTRNSRFRRDDIYNNGNGNGTNFNFRNRRVCLIMVP